jgi:hypothetical protein
MKRPARPVAVVQIPREEEWKFDNKRDGKFGTPLMALFVLKEIPQRTCPGTRCSGSAAGCVFSIAPSFFAAA